jgi:AraC-like DNA-binding protein
MATTKVDVAEDALSRLYGAVALGSPGSEPFRYAQRVDGDDTFTLTRMQFGARLGARNHVEGKFSVGQLLGGRFGYHDYRGVCGDSAAPMLFPEDRPVHADIQGADILVADLNIERVLEMARQRCGDDSARFRFESFQPASAELAHYWTQLVRHLYRDVAQRPELMAVDIIRANVFEQLAVAALSVFPVVDETAQETPVDVMPRMLRRACAFIDENAHEPITIVDIARAAGATSRAVQYAFQRHLDTTPLAYLRAARLSAAHAELLVADPATMNVADIARRWGFTHLGRFAGAHVESFGEYPSETLRR